MEQDRKPRNKPAHLWSYILNAYLFYLRHVPEDEGLVCISVKLDSILNVMGDYITEKSLQQLIVRRLFP